MKICLHCTSEIPDEAIKCKHCGEWIVMLHEKGENQEIEKLRFTYAWNWFDFHAKQRMQLFNFFLIITGILANAYVIAYEKNIHLMSMMVCILGTLQAVGFYIFDIRSREMTNYAEDILEKLERDSLFPDNFNHPAIKQGRTLGLLRQESDSKMKEGKHPEIGWKNLRKIKVWIRIIELFVGVAFLIGLILALYQTSKKIGLVSKTISNPQIINSNIVSWSCFDGHQCCLEYKRHDYEKGTIRNKPQPGNHDSSPAQI